MTRKNFNTHIARDFKAEAKKLLNGIFEAESLETLNALYSPKEVQNPEINAANLKHTILPFEDVSQNAEPLMPVSSDVASLGAVPGKPETLQLDIKKPIKFKVVDKSNKTTNAEVVEGATVKDDKIVISLDKKQDCDEPYDFLQSAPPLDLSNDVSDSADDSVKALTDLVQSASGGMMPKVVAISGQPLPTDRVLIKPNDIKPIEEDPEGFSVVGMDNDIGSFMLAPPTKK